MSETNPNPPLDDEQPPPAPRPGLRLPPPGAVPALPPASEPEATTPPAAAGEPDLQPAAERPAKKTRKVKGRSAGGSRTGSKPGSPDATTTPTSSSTGSSEQGFRVEPPPQLVEPTQLTEDLTAMLLAVGATANDRYAPGTPLFIADRAEAHGVARPAARVITRHTPAGLGGPGNPDLADAIAAGITLVRYMVRQIRLWFEVKRHRAAGTGPGDQDVEDAA